MNHPGNLRWHSVRYVSYKSIYSQAVHLLLPMEIHHRSSHAHKIFIPTNIVFPFLAHFISSLLRFFTFSFISLFIISASHFIIIMLLFFCCYFTIFFYGFIRFLWDFHGNDTVLKFKEAMDSFFDKQINSKLVRKPDEFLNGAFGSIEYLIATWWAKPASFTWDTW